MAWFHDSKQLIWWLAASSAITILATLIAVPWLVVRMPADYFVSRQERAETGAHAHPAVHMLLAFGRNAIGYLFIAAGILMLALPGQGVLTLLMGIVLAQFPGKRRLQNWLVSRGPVLAAINWLRRRAGKPPMQARTPAAQR